MMMTLVIIMINYCYIYEKCLFYLTFFRNLYFFAKINSQKPLFGVKISQEMAEKALLKKNRI